MGNLPSSTSTEPLAQGKHRNLSSISLPPTIPRRHNMKDAERKEIFPISDELAPPLSGRRGSIGFFRGKRALAPMTLNHEQLFQNLQNLQNLDMTHCSWQSYNCLDSCPSSNLNSLSTTPTTAATTPAMTATPTTPVTGGHLVPYGQSSFSQPTSPIAVSIQDYHPRQEQKLASFMKRNLLPQHALCTPSPPLSSEASPTSCSLANSASSSPTIDSCSDIADHHYDHHPHNPNHHQHHQLPHHTARPALEHQSSVDTIPSTLDVPSLTISEWGNRHKWAGEQEWSDDIPDGLEHEGGLWDVMDRQVLVLILSLPIFLSFLVLSFFSCPFFVSSFLFFCPLVNKQSKHEALWSLFSLPPCFFAAMCGWDGRTRRGFSFLLSS